MPNAWKKDKAFPLLLSPYRRGIFFFFLLLFLIIFIFLRPLSSQNPNRSIFHLRSPLLPFDCAVSPQASPVFSARVEGLHHPFLYSLADFGSLPEKPHKNIVRMLKGKPFRRPDISFTIQEFLRGSNPSDGIVIDVGANVGMASFAAAALGFSVVAFEPVFENLQRICDGVFLNRFWDRMVIYEAAASDRLGNITLHKERESSCTFSAQGKGTLTVVQIVSLMFHKTRLLQLLLGILKIVFIVVSFEAMLDRHNEKIGLKCSQMHHTFLERKGKNQSFNWWCIKHG